MYPPRCWQWPLLVCEEKKNKEVKLVSFYKTVGHSSAKEIFEILGKARYEQRNVLVLLIVDLASASSYIYLLLSYVAAIG